MADLGNTSVFSQTDGSNGSGTMPSWLGSAAPSTLDDAGRALQGAVTREWNWRNVTLTAAGTADVKTLTYSVAPAAYYNGQQFAFIANTTNTTTVTLNVNSLGAKTIKKMVAGTATNLAAGDMISGAYVQVAYNTVGDYFVWTNFDMSTALVVSAGSATAPYGSITITGSGILGYGTGSGGTVTQLTSKITGVTLNKTNGQVTMNAAALGAGATASFAISNTTVANTDTVIANVGGSGFGSLYTVAVNYVSAGTIGLRVTNISGGSLSEAVVISFSVIKAVTS